MQDRSSSKPKRPRDLNQLAANLVAAATSNESADLEKPAKNPHAAALGRLGGKKGGPARAAKLTAEQRREIAKRAAAKRWAARGTLTQEESPEAEPSSTR